MCVFIQKEVLVGPIWIETESQMSGAKGGNLFVIKQARKMRLVKEMKGEAPTVFMILSPVNLTMQIAQEVGNKEQHTACTRMNITLDLNRF